MKFTLEAADAASKARAGTLFTSHGEVQTPIFMPVATTGAMKGVHQTELETDTKARIVLGNTYHLFLRPGTEVIRRAGGLHKFIHWDGPMLTDSGGFQVYSLANSRKLTEEGVAFSSHIDGAKLLFTPENVVEKQRLIGADIIMALDECTPYPCEYDYAKKSMEMTHRWLKRGVTHFQKTEPEYGYEQAFFPIVQGSTFPDLRARSAEYIASMNMTGNAIGGLSVGEPAEEMYACTELVCNILPWDKPRYLMGVGTPANILECIALGIDMFDCVMPTRNGRNGWLFTKNGIINIKNEKWKFDYSPLEEDGPSWASKYYSKAYLRHLMYMGERLAAQIASLHNLAFYLWLVTEARQHIVAGDFASWKTDMVKKVTTRL